MLLEILLLRLLKWIRKCKFSSMSLFRLLEIAGSISSFYLFLRYRAKVLEISESNVAEVFFVDYGDKRHVPGDSLRQIQPHFLKLRFQAMEATLNLE